MLESIQKLAPWASGLPVVASDATCHPEVCGDAAVYCDPTDSMDVAEKIHRVITDRDFAEDLRRKGWRRLRGFSWERSAIDYLEEIEAVAAGSMS